MPKFISDIDLNKNNLKNVVIENLSEAPSSPLEGQIYYDTTSDSLKVYDGSSWASIVDTPIDNSPTNASSNLVTSGGVYSSINSSMPLMVTVTATTENNETTYTADKTFTEIYAAFNNNQVVIAKHGAKHFQLRSATNLKAVFKSVGSEIIEDLQCDSSDNWSLNTRNDLYVSFNRDQSSNRSEAEKAQARKNIGAANTNPNLLDNWYWVGGGAAGKFPINQRGKNYYAVNDYTIDRWKSVNPWGTSFTAKVATQEGGLVLAGDIDTDNPNSYVQFQQIVDNPPYGKEVTLSLLVDTLGADEDGNYPQIWCGASAYENITTVGLVSKTFTWSTTQTENYIRIVLYNGATQASSIRIQAVKLEIGSVSTLEKDVAPDYGIELTKCIYSKADSSDTYSNGGYGRTNPNILVNGYFIGGGGPNSFPINSRRQTTYTGSTWTVDCWRTWDGGTTLTVGAQGLTFSNNLNGDAIFQYIKDPSYLYGKTITVSAIINNKVYSATGVASSDCWIATADDDVYSLRFSVDNVSGYGYVCVQIVSGKTITIEAIKLETGSVSTIVGDAPQDRELEYIRSVSYPVFYGDTVAGRAITPTSNRNLLDNWYFVGGGSQLGNGHFPINQREQTSYSGSGVTTFDRWICDYNATATLQSGGVRVQISALYSGLTQIIPAYKMKDGETYTFSIIVDGTLHSATFTAHDDGSWNNILFGNDWYVPYQFTNGNWYFKALNASNVDAFDHLVSAVKLEKGTVSTLANDVPPDFSEELRKCQMYLRYVPFIRTLIALESTYTIAIKTLEGIEMASYPTATLTQAGTVMQVSPQAWATPTGVSVIAFNHYTPTIQFSLSSTLDGVGYIVDTIICLSCEP